MKALFLDKTSSLSLRDVTNEVLEIVRADKAIQAGDTHRVIELVDAKVLPHFDFRRMTMLAVGRDWRQASAEQQTRLTDAFRTLLVRTYSNALTQPRAMYSSASRREHRPSSAMRLERRILSDWESMTYPVRRVAQKNQKP